MLQMGWRNKYPLEELLLFTNKKDKVECLIANTLCLFVSITYHVGDGISLTLFWGEDSLQPGTFNGKVVIKNCSVSQNINMLVVIMAT